jgi:tetratricopeptide (TPR) repeat protein
MAKKHEHTEDILSKIGKNIEGFVVKYLKIILLSICAVVILVASYFGLQYFFTRQEKEAESMFSKVYLVYDRTNNDSSLGEDQMKDKLLSLGEDFKLVISTYPKSSAASRSAYYLGNIMFRYGEYEEALSYYEKGAQIKSKGYSALLCIQSQATCYEQLEEYDKAEEQYKRIIDKYDKSFLVPMVRFSLGQIYEKQGKYKEAKEQYDVIVTDYSWSSWADLAEKKMLVLQES